MFGQREIKRLAMRKKKKKENIDLLIHLYCSGEDWPYPSLRMFLTQFQGHNSYLIDTIQEF